VFFFIGEFSPKFDLENMISTSASDFSWKEIAQICQILKKEKKLKSPKHYDVLVDGEEYRRIRISFSTFMYRM
jgi:hypothetical protein